MGMGLQPLLAFLVLAEGCSRALCLVLPLNGDWRTGYNNVTVELSSPVLYAVDRARASARVHAIPPECPPLRQRSVCSANQIRKTQTSFGWEFAPAFPTMGIW
ncbi:conserved hypothetical protein [Ixodes scapularis]|uniref:Beta-mannosidase-like galactose-binding domain-containing protein n=1 Tax=Ixodes scapularis TaxID=6945 RepID=B7QBJ0_IXOSC|nr:conserved hypothetical protein [Ixodes scapularis]|eukprot:XP_002412916.1 conserved hypothetical protein [Ixodes scapularis]